MLKNFLGGFKMKKIFSLVTAAMFMIVGFVSAAEIEGSGYIQVEGVQYYKEKDSLNDARRMAEMKAYRALAESIGDLRVSSESTMKNEMLDDRIKIKVEQTIRGAKLVAVDRDTEKFVAKVRLNIFGGANSIADIVVPTDTAVEPFPEFDPKFVTIDSNYTGLIIDCGGQEISTAILPKIQSVSGKEVYSFKYVERNVVVGRGMVGYSDDANSGTKRAGSNPLTVQAMYIQGDCDVVISDEDAEKILAANSKSNFLKTCGVVFVK